MELSIYTSKSGKCPFDDWFESIHEVHTKAKILTRLDRLKLGNFGDCKGLGDGLGELRVHYGPGIRIYYSKVGNTIILLLSGGVKKSQAKDIKRAKEYLQDYKSRKKGYG